MKTEKVINEPREIIKDIIEWNKQTPDSLTALFSISPVVMIGVINFNDLEKIFPQDLVDDMSKFNKKSTTSRNKIIELLATKSNAVFGNGLTLDTATTTAESNSESFFSSRVYNEKQKENIFYGGDLETYTNVNCPYDMMVSNSVTPTKENTLLRTEECVSNVNSIVSIVGNSMYLVDKGGKKIWRYEFSYYPLHVLDIQQDYISIMGIDEFAFPIVKTYDLNKIYTESDINTSSAEETNKVVNTKKSIIAPQKTKQQNNPTSPPQFTITNPKKNTSLSIGFSKNDEGVTIGFQVLKDDNPISFLPTDYASVEITLFGKDVKFHTFNITQTQLGVADGSPEVSLDKNEWATFYKKAVNTNCKLISVVGKAENGQKIFTEMFTLSDSEMKMLQLQIATVAETKKSPTKPAKQVQVNDVSKQFENNNKEQEKRTTQTSSDETNTGNQTNNTSQEKSNVSNVITTNKTPEKPVTPAASTFFTVTNSTGINISFAFAKEAADHVIMKVTISKDDIPYTFPSNSLVCDIGLYKKGPFKVNDPLVTGEISNAMMSNSSFVFRYNKKIWNSLYTGFLDNNPEFVMFKVYKKGDNIKEIFDLTPEQVAGILKQIKEIGKL